MLPLIVKRFRHHQLDTDQRFGLVLLIIAAALHLAYVVINIDQPLLEGFAFRQAQTALTSFWFLQEGWQMPPPLPLFGPPWSVPMEFPLYQAIVAGVVSLTHWPLDLTGRILSLVFFYLSLPALTLLARRLPLTPGQCLLIPAVALLTPVHLFFARSFGIESLAFCTAVWFLFGYERLGRKPTNLTIVITVLLAVAAALTKITTYLVFLVPALMLTVIPLWEHGLTGWRKYLRPWTTQAFCALLGLAVGYAWVQYGDAVKSTNPLSLFLMSERLHDWTYGPLEMRFGRAFWEGVLFTTQRDVLAMGNLALAVLVTLTGSPRHRIAALLLGLCFLAGPLAFANLYTVHIYYYFANTIFALAILVLAWSCLLQPTSRHWGMVAVVLSMGLQVAGFHRGLFPAQRDHNYTIPASAEWIKATTEPDEVVVMLGEDWVPILPYYAERRVIMLSNQDAGNVEAIDDVISRLPAGSLAGFLVTAPPNPDPGYENFLVRRFGMAEWPALKQGDSRLYLPRHRAQALAEQLPPELAGNWSWRGAWESGITGLELEQVDLSTLPDLNLAEVISPVPSEIRTIYGISAAKIGGKPALNVHAPTVMKFDFPQGLTSAHLQFGLTEASYSYGNNTDGILFRLEFEHPDQADREILWEQLLTPASNESHRGLHTWEGSFPSTGPGRVYLSALVGPAADLTFDWGLWTKVELK